MDASCSATVLSEVLNAAKQQNNKSPVDDIVSQIDFMEIAKNASKPRRHRPYELDIILSLIRSSEISKLHVQSYYIISSDLLTDYSVHDYNKRLENYLKKMLIGNEQKVLPATSVQESVAAEDNTHTCVECAERYHEIMRTSIPVSYAVFGAIVFALMCIFGTIFCIGQFTNSLIMNPKFSILSFLGCLVLLLTDIIACRSWRKLIDEDERQ